MKRQNNNQDLKSNIIKVLCIHPNLQTKDFKFDYHK